MRSSDGFSETLEDLISDAHLTTHDLDSEVEDKELISHRITNVSFLEVRDDYILCECEFEIEFECIITFDDPDSFHWDSEDRRAWPTHSHRKHATLTDCFCLEVELTRPDSRADWDVDLVPHHISKSISFDPRR